MAVLVSWTSSHSVSMSAGVVAVCGDVSGVPVFPEFEAGVAADGVAADFPDVFFDGFDDACGVCVGFDAHWCSFARFLCS